MKTLILKSLELKNFKRHRNLMIEFDEGLNVITGPNYCGKSTVLHAILFAQFGAVAVPGRKERMVSRGQKALGVRLEFVSGEVISRSLSTATVVKDGELIASGHSSVTQWVEEQLGLDWTRAKMLYYSPQTETAALTTLGVPALNRLIEEVSGADFIEKVITRASLKASVATQRLDELEMPGDLDALKQALEDAQSVHGSAAEDLATYRVQEKEAQQLVLQSRDLVRTCELKVASRNMKLRQLAEIEGRHAGLNASYSADFERWSAGEDLAGKFSEAERTWVAASTKHGEAIEARKKRDELFAGMNDWVRWLASTGEPWEERQGLIATYAKLTKQLAAAQAVEVETYTAQVATLTAYQSAKDAVASSVCSACNRPLEGAHLKTAQTQMAKADKANAKAYGAWTRAKEERHHIEITLGEIDENLIPPDDWAKQLADGREQVEEYKKLLAPFEDVDSQEQAARRAFDDSLRAKVEIGTQLAQHTALGSDLDRRYAQLDALEKEMDALRAHPDLAADREAELGQLRTQLATMDKAHDELRNKVMKLIGEESDLRNKVANGLEAVNHCAYLKEERRELETVKADYGGLTSWLRTSKARFLTDIWDGLLAISGDFLAQATGGNVSELVRDQDGSFSILESGLDGSEAGETEMDGSSGGQRAIAGTGLRVALASLLPVGPGFLLLDEPTSELNEEHAAALTGALRALGRQLVMVSHREADVYGSTRVLALAEG